MSNGRQLPQVQAQASASDTAQLQYTGGTTGRSKGAALAHSALLANVASAEQWLGRRLDPATDEQIPDRLAHLSNIVSCYSVAGEASYLLMVQVATPADLESLLAKIRVAAGASTLTSLVLSIPFQDRPVL